MGANNFLALATITAGSGAGAASAIDLWALVPSTGVEGGFTVICVGDFSGLIALEGSLDGTNFSPVGNDADGNPVGGFRLGNPATGGITPENLYDLTPLNVPDTIRYLRARVAPGTLVRSNITLTVGGAQNCTCALGGVSGVGFHYQYFARDFYTPTNSNWAVNAGASLVPDTINPALLVQRFNQTEQGIGWELRIEPSMTRFSMLINSRPQLAPSVINQHVHPFLYYRNIGNGISVGPWLQRDFDSYPPQQRIDFVPSSIQFQTDTFVFALGVSGPTLAAGTMWQFELTRESGVCLNSDWDVVEVHIETT